jgi:hypothetical protein
MTEREEKDLAWRIAEGSEVFDFETALELVQRRPAEAERLLRNRQRGQERREELDRAFQRLRLAARELF